MIVILLISLFCFTLPQHTAYATLDVILMLHLSSSRMLRARAMLRFDTRRRLRC